MAACGHVEPGTASGVIVLGLKVLCLPAHQIKHETHLRCASEWRLSTSRHGV